MDGVYTNLISIYIYIWREYIYKTCVKLREMVVVSDVWS
jgi:hypothetical protein